MRPEIEDLLNPERSTDTGDMSVPSRPVSLTWSLLAAMSVAGTVVAAGLVFSEQGIGAATAARGCRPELAAGYLLLLAAGLITGLTVATAVQPHRRGGRTTASMLVACAVVGLAATPAALGCRVVRRLDGVALLDGAMTGVPGMVVAAAATTLVGLIAGILLIRPTGGLQQ